MASQPGPPFGERRATPADALRRQAEVRALRPDSPELAAESPEVRHLIHELSVHQFELEMQNEELRRTQAELQTSRSRYFDLYHQAPIGYFTVALQARILECNLSGAAMLGLPTGSLVNRRLLDFIWTPARPAFLEAWDRMVATGESEALELPLIRADAVRIWVHLRMNLGREEGEPHPVGRITLMDITERKLLGEETARLAAIVTSASHAIVSCTLAGEVTSWNDGAERLFGYSAPEITGQRIGLLFPASRRHEEVHSRYRVGQGETVAREIELIRRNGTTVPVFATASPIYDSVGRIDGISFIALDIQEQVLARDRLGHALRQLEAGERALREADRRKDDFIATLAHELRNPLSPIRNAAAVLRHSNNLDRSGEWARDVIDRQVGHMAALLEDLLDVSRITRNTITLKIERLDLARVIEQAIEIARPQLEARRLELTLELPSHPVELMGDPTRLTQIFDNLLSNAAKYTDPGGRIGISVALEGGEAVVRVSDSGIGIDPDHLPRIFELFSQVETVIERAQGGLGIGLALVKGLVNKHGGTIEATSDGPGRGSEFVVRLPGAVVGRREPEPTVLSAREATGRPTPVDGRRILVVDDNPDAAESMVRMLRLHGYEVLAAGSGEQALVLARQHRPRVILLDVGMPGLNGYDVARRIRSESWGREVTLIACTGWGQPEDRRRTQGAGFDHHLVKPCAPESVLQLLSAVPPVAEDNIHS